MPTVIDIPKVGQIAFPDTMGDDEINVAAGELYDRADKGERLRKESAGQLRKAARASANLKIWDLGDKTVRATMGALGTASEWIREGLASSQGFTTGGLQRGRELITGSEKQPITQITSRDIAEQAKYQPDETDPVYTKVGKGVANALVGLAADIISPEGVVMAPLGVGGLGRKTLMAAIAGQSTLAAEGGIEALSAGDVQAGTEQLAMATAGAYATYALRPGGLFDMTPQSTKTVANAAEWLRDAVEAPKKAEIKPETTLKEVADAGQEVVQGELKVEADAAKPKEAAVDVRSGITDVDARWDAAHGIGKKSLWTRTKEKLTSAKENFQRHFIDLDPKTDGAVINTLRVAEEIPIYSKFTAARNMSSIIGKLDKAKMDVFERAVILPDLVKDVEAGLHSGKDLPFG